MMRLVIILLLSVVLSFAGSEEIIRLIEEVKKAPPEERYKVMNRLKLKLREMNQREREEAIKRVYMELKGERHEGRHEREEERHEERFEHERGRAEEMEEKFQEKFEEKHEDMHEEMEERMKKKGNPFDND